MGSPSGAEQRVFRLSAKAIVFEDDRLLAIHCRDRIGDFYYLPGGGQQIGETVHEALRRECHEEIGCPVEIGPLWFVRDYMAWNHEFADEEGDIHQVELMFQRTIAPGRRPGPASAPDGMQVGHAWLPLGDLRRSRFYPLAMRGRLQEAARSGLEGAMYLGAIN